ncbi:hypothetical protein P3H15_55095, partial [Rhodococcus sp. T2V]|uniref:hypothetical protein n=1 Tax=Rhodococcus sp. T2V TaxID=3034164 RepID=UPI0023E1383C
HQPVWRAAIIAHCRWRGRRVAMRIGREHGRWPIRTVTDSWVYLLAGATAKSLQHNTPNHWETRPNTATALA